MRHADISKQRFGYHVDLFGHGGWSHIRGGKFTLTLWGATRLARQWIRQPPIYLLEDGNTTAEPPERKES